MHCISRHIPLPAALLSLTLVSLITCVPLIILSTFNYGVLSLWLNASVAALVIVFHVTIIYLSWRKRTGGYYASSSSSSPPSRSGSLTAKVPFTLTLPTILVAKTPVETTRPSLAYSVPSLVCLAILCTMSTIAFGSIVSLTLHGVQSLLPAERVSIRPWNKKVQIAQSVVLGAQTLLLSIIFLMCLLGRRKVHRGRRESQEEAIYGLRTPVPGTMSEKSWTRNKALELV